ncbi:histidine kinase [Rhizobium sp. Root708]|uniref:response regulator n=1 Tax=Rhizobium sp. Root708 TaxID=1736592 RepID=UPI0006F91989|nr:response regulator [Rhizobium sp. Root708]KRB49250.1 histidine kinase [Rhizobium sp. Root708]
MSDDRQQWIAKRAYALWEQAGRPFWQDGVHWRQAVLERDLLEQTCASADGEEVLNRIRLPSFQKVETNSTVLIVEDEAQLRYATVDFLENAGYKTLEAANADEALVILRSNDITTLFTDIDMPGSMDGLGLVRTVRLRWPSTRIIVTSGLVKLSHQDMESGVTFISKPASSLELLGLMS